jgi:hypothetical protein
MRIPARCVPPVFSAHPHVVPLPLSVVRPLGEKMYESTEAPPRSCFHSH